MAEPSLLTSDIVIEYIARGHAFNKHVLGYDHEPSMTGLNAFRETESRGHFDKQANRWMPPQHLGDDLFIETPDDMADHIKTTFLTSRNTIGYISNKTGGVNLFNTKDNVALHISWNNKDRDFGSVYRYPSTPTRFMLAAKAEKKKAEILGIPFKAINNMDDPEAAMNAVEVLIDDINTNPQNYLFNPNNHDSTVQNRVLANASRPGRDWESDEVLRAPNNVKGHSKSYAEENKLDVAASDYVCIKEASADEFNVGRARKSLRSGRVLNSIKEHGFDSAPEPILAIA
ncbi:MAG: hypothetical protein ACRBDI_10690 [Alphaproteobacteria bacterium]